MIKKINITIFLLIISLSRINAQNIDSFFLVDTSNFYQLTNDERLLLKMKLPEITEFKNDSLKVVKLNELYNQMNDNDVWAEYLKLMNFYLNKSSITDSSFYYNYKINYNIDYGYYQDYSGHLDSALLYYNEAYDISKRTKDTLSIIASLKNIGAIYRFMGLYPSAIEAFETGLNYSIQLKDSINQAFILLNLGKLNINIKEIKPGIEYLYESLNIRKQIGNKHEIAICMNDIAIELSKIPDSINVALDFFHKAIYLSESVNDKRNLATVFNNIGAYYNRIEQYDSAIYFQIKAAELAKAINFNDGYITMIANIGKIYFATGKMNEAQKYGEESYELAKKQDKISLTEGPSYLLYRVYKKLGNSSKALLMHETYINAKDSISNSQNKQSTIRQRAKYEYEKREAITKANFDKQLALADAERKKQRLIIFSFLAGFLIILVFSIFLYRLFIQKKKANIQLSLKKVEVEQKNEEITAQRDEIMAQRDLVTNQKNEITLIHEELTDSINYAKRIQEAVLPISIESRSILGEHFILFRPKDIVSGDFYWTAKIENTLIVAVADCTGHGVPGAFMSMLGISFLNEIVRKKEILQASEVLNELRKEIINALQQKGTSGEQKDGMDMSLLAIDTKSNNAQWAGANNPLWIVKSPKPQSQNSKTQELDTLSKSLDLGLGAWFFELKADKMPIAIYDKMDDFTNHELQLNLGDILYLMSDGYEDQFGGPKGKKFLSKNLKQLLLDNSQKTMSEQKDILEKTLIEWIGEGEQIDDITIMGIKI